MINKTEKLEQLIEIRTNFRNKLSILQKAKHSLMKLFRKRLEEKKLEEIRHNLLEK